MCTYTFYIIINVQNLMEIQSRFNHIQLLITTLKLQEPRRIPVCSTIT